MTIAARINATFVSAALVLTLLLTAFTAFREYHIARERTVDAALAEIRSHPDLQLAIYNRDAPRLRTLMAGFLEIPAVASAITRDGLGELLAKVEGPGGSEALQPPFSALRGDLSTVDTGLTAFDAQMNPEGNGLWTAWTGDGLPLYLTVPVFTAVNPAQQGLVAYDFFLAPADPAANSSLRVIGYMQVAISRERLLEGIGPVIQRLFYGCLVLIVLCGAGTALATRRITRDLSRLAQLADEVASGKVEKPLEIKASGEIRDIAAVLNSVIGGFTSLQREKDVGQRLLSMKVDERTSQLSRRDEELTRATQEISATQTRLQRLAYYDSLTTLPNRRLFTEQLDLLLGLNHRNGHTLALLFFNMDNFKRINDSLGHRAGDQVLQEVAKRLSLKVRGSDSVGHNVDAGESIDVSRLGGDEFTVVLNQLDSIESAIKVGQRLLDEVERPMTIDGQELVVSPSIGVAIAPRDGADVEALLRAAGIAMHHAKESVRDKIRLYSSDMIAVGGRLELESDLRKAVERGELVLHYQPQINTLTGAVIGAEALLRWMHPEHGAIPPSQFIPVAEEIGVIGQLGDWVLAEVCRQLKAFDELGLKLPKVAINISAFQFTERFTQRVQAILQEVDLPASRLELGLSEGTLVDDDGTARQILADLKAAGMYLSVDDFGTGHAPLSYLGRYVVDEIKIDRSFVQDCDRSESSARLVGAIIAMARSLELGIVAEGVEREEQYHFLIGKGAEILQGYLFSKPVPPEELQAMLAPWHFVEQLQAMKA